MTEESEKNVRIFKLSYSGMLLKPEINSEEEKMALFNFFKEIRKIM